MKLFALAFAATLSANDGGAPTALPPLPPLPPLAAEWLEEIKDATGKETIGFVSPPTGAIEPRPVVIAVHGAGDRPDWACSAWRAIFGPRPFIVCPRGGAIGPPAASFAWSGADHVSKAIARSEAAVALRFGPHVGEGPRVYAGFSQGAVIGARIVARSPKTYPYAVFLEGLGDVTSEEFVRAFSGGGGQRVLLACSQGGCLPSREAARGILAKRGVAVRAHDVGHVGHVINGVVIAALRQDVPWLLEPAPPIFAGVP